MPSFGVGGSFKIYTALLYAFVKPFQKLVQIVAVDENRFLNRFAVGARAAKAVHTDRL